MGRRATAESVLEFCLPHMGFVFINTTFSYKLNSFTFLLTSIHALKVCKILGIHFIWCVCVCVYPMIEKKKVVGVVNVLSVSLSHRST